MYDYSDGCDCRYFLGQSANEAWKSKWNMREAHCKAVREEHMRWKQQLPVLCALRRVVHLYPTHTYIITYTPAIVCVYVCVCVWFIRHVMSWLQ